MNEVIQQVNSFLNIPTDLEWYQYVALAYGMGLSTKILFKYVFKDVMALGRKLIPPADICKVASKNQAKFYKKLSNTVKNIPLDRISVEDEGYKFTISLSGYSNPLYNIGYIILFKDSQKWSMDILFCDYDKLPVCNHRELDLSQSDVINLINIIEKRLRALKVYNTLKKLSS